MYEEKFGRGDGCLDLVYLTNAVSRENRMLDELSKYNLVELVYFRDSRKIFSKMNSLLSTLGKFEIKIRQVVFYSFSNSSNSCFIESSQS